MTFAYSCFPSIQLYTEIQLFRLRIIVNAIRFFASLVNIVETTLIDGLFPMQPLFQSNIPSINLVFNQIYH